MAEEEEEKKKKKKTRLQGLLRASKRTLRFLLRDDLGTLSEEEKEGVIDMLSNAIDIAEGPDFAANLASITLVMTKGTIRTLIEAVDKRDDGSREHKVLSQWVQDGIRTTKQRIYLRLDIDHGLMRKLKMILLTTKTKHSDKAFKRLADQIEEQGLSKNPLEVLAEIGL